MPLPESIDVLIATLLVVTAAVTSFITAAMGIGGGVLLLAVMALFVPAGVLIPVHGFVQFGSNANRALMTRQHIDWQMVKFFAIGALLGALCASMLVVQLPLQVIEISVALFIFYLLWGPKPAEHQMKPTGLALVGVLTTFLSMFVGATGPLVAAYVHRQSYDKMTTTATFASCMSLQHLLKMFVFSAIGFSLWEWAPLILCMIASGFLGTWLGLKALHRIPAEHFKTGFRIIVTLLALRLLWQALFSSP